MARVTLVDLQSRALQRVDAVNSQFVSTSELNYLINVGVARLHDILVTAYEDYYSTRKLFSLVAGQEAYDLVTDLGLIDGSGNPLFYKVLELFAVTGSGSNISRQKLKMFNRNELTRLNNPVLTPTYTVFPVLCWRLEGTKLFMEPVPTSAAGFQIELWYVPQITPLVADADTIDYSVVQGWEEYIVNEVAINIRLKEESDVSGLMARQAEFESRVTAAAGNRSLGDAPRVVDVEGNWGYPFDAYR